MFLYATQPAKLQSRLYKIKKKERLIIKNLHIKKQSNNFAPDFLKIQTLKHKLL